MSLLRLECKLLFRQREYAVACGSYALLCLLAALLGLGQMHRHRGMEQLLDEGRIDAARTALDLARSADAGSVNPGQFRDPRDVSNYVRVVLNAPVTMPEAATGVLSSADLNGGSWYYNLNLGPQMKSLSGVEYDSPELARMGRIDLAFIITLVLPLFMIAVGYSVWTTDREEKIERLVGMGVQPRSTIYCVRLLLATAPLVTLTLLVCGMAIMLARSYADNAALLRSSLLLAFTVLLYSLFWIAVIFAAIGTRIRPFAALARLLLCWVVLCVVLPALAQWNARIVAPLPSRSALLDRSREDADRIGKAPAALQRDYLDKYPRLDVSGSKPLPSGALALMLAEASDRFVREQEERVMVQQWRQHAILRAWSLVTPPLLVQKSMAAFAGDSLGDRLRFHACALAYLDQLRGFYRPVLFGKSALIASSTQAFGSYPQYRCSVEQ